MIKHIPPASRIFIGLSIITLLLIFLAINLSKLQQETLIRQGNQHSGKTTDRTSTVISEHEILSTEDWVEYIDPAYPLAFLYPKDWTVESFTNDNGFYDIALTPADSKTTIDFYISNKSYLGFQGFKGSPFTVDQTKGEIISDALIGVKKGDYYYTFDGSFSGDYNDEFYTIMQTVKFDRM